MQRRGWWPVNGPCQTLFSWQRQSERHGGQWDWKFRGGDEGDDEESGLGSSDNDDKIHCSICAGEILEDNWLTARCGHHVCESCHQDDDEHLRHVKGNSDLQDAMTELCGLSHSVCLHEWPPEFVFPKRIIALRGVGLSSKHHKDTAAEQKRAGFDWAEICELLDKHNLWPERWTSVIKTAVKQKNLGRKAKLRRQRPS